MLTEFPMMLKRTILMPQSVITLQRNHSIFSPRIKNNPIYKKNLLIGFGDIRPEGSTYYGQDKPSELVTLILKDQQEMVLPWIGPYVIKTWHPGIAMLKNLLEFQESMMD